MDSGRGETVALAFDYHAALSVIPGAAAWTRLQQFRVETTSRTIRRWPPHINIVYPFLAPSRLRTQTEALVLLALLLKEVGPFSVRLRQVGTFRHRRSTTVVLFPETCPNALDAKGLARLPESAWTSTAAESNACSQLRSLALAKLDGYPATSFRYTPHLTISNSSDVVRAEQWRLALAESLERNPIYFAVDKVHIITRTASSPFRNTFEIPLDKDAPALVGPLEQNEYEFDKHSAFGTS